MPTSKAHSLVRLSIGVLAVITLLVYLYPSSSSTITSRLPNMTGSNHVDPIPRLSVTLAQVPDASPPALRATITNHNPFPVSFLDYDSAMDSLAVPLGLVELTPSGALADAEPVALDNLVQLRRLWPPKVAFVQEVPGGGGTVVSDDIVLKPANVPYGKLGDTFYVRIKGPWRAVMTVPKSEITKEFLEHIPDRPKTYQGSYESDRLEITVDAASLELK
ncbi:uncharacterized protein BBA_05759 [Beauveria bassiana ARSEF 2860]|uniref:Uncharacterized protein n=1 Tax=Beauveria bassiana (strain ARSEF 2860) TaxID=655819 RepID=J5JIN9_BEAB2|nr:uncharacterized protein BBA_05759 [Beauveria bassiana ARSEF 2860]EJP65428.1 hypothetical protein BBA_05759 [Beauveria bassiana ARSEF 2860]